MKKKLNASIFFILIIIISCKKEMYLESPENAVAGNFKDVFIAFWNGLSKNYLFWDVDSKNVNWDQMYVKYLPKFERLNINNINDLVEGKEYLNEMVKDLSDGHLSITFNHPILSRDTIFPAKIRNAKRITLEHSITDSQLYDINPKLYFTGVPSIVFDPNTNLHIIKGMINENMLYFHFNYFYLNKAYQTNGQIKLMIDTLFKELDFETTKCLILDFRNNRGGNAEDLNFFLGKFINLPVHFGYLKYKMGNNRTDYTPDINAFVFANSNKPNKKPIYILIDARTISMAEISVLAFKETSTTTLVGKRTWGAQGLVVADNILYQGGSFKVSNFMNVSESAASLQTLDKINYEGKGIVPNIDITQSDNGRDDQLEYIIKLGIK